MSIPHFDLVVIGSGPAGEKGAAQAAWFGKSVCLIEREPELGGAMVNTGTVPSKTLRETALTLSGLRSRDLYGVDLSIRREATVADFMRHERNVVAQERGRIERNLDAHKVTRVTGTASFLDPHTIAVDPGDGPAHTVTAGVVLIATGSSPRRPPELFPPGEARVFDSDTILHLTTMPRRLVVVGGGVIGSEYACTFAALGVQTTIVDRGERLLAFLDHEVGDALQGSMAALGVQLRHKERVASLESHPDEVVLQLASGARLGADAVLIAAGRISNTAGLGLELAGVEVGERGLVQVDRSCQTNVPHIYAAGDVVGFPALASTSMEQAHVAMVRAFGKRYKTSVAEVLPYGIHTIPECATAGATEESARKAGVDYVVGRARYADNARGRIIGDERGFLKLLFRRGDMRLIGVHLVGEGAIELVHVGAMALLTGATADTFIRACFNYPTLGELYKYATYDAMGS